MPGDLRFVCGDAGTVSARVVAPPAPRAALVLAHGAGAGMDHPFMERLARALAGEGMATLRFQFPYMEAGRRRPDPPAVARETVRQAVSLASRELKGVPLFAGGKSFGGRMTSQAAAEEALPGARGIVFFGFPLHPAGSPATERAEHLVHVGVPVLFIQGTRDALADLELLEPVVARLGARATLHVVDGADHSFGVLKRSGRTETEVLEEIAAAAAAFMGRLA